MTFLLLIAAAAHFYHQQPTARAYNTTLSHFLPLEVWFQTTGVSQLVERASGYVTVVSQCVTARCTVEREQAVCQCE